MLAARNLTFLLSVLFSAVFPKFYARFCGEIDRERDRGKKKVRIERGRREGEERKRADLTFKVKFPLAWSRIKLSRIYFCYPFFFWPIARTLHVVN